ncbi:hypothetical protein SDC9_100005 [bioreactor metagenome]|uniref:Uncharacterized protein n=1 Tax=bioreactor metagenome TaxID=1076179 RepID=A0A645AJD0_9ZZZZ
MDCQRILSSDVDESTVSTDGLATDGHRFKHRVRIPFKGGAVHVCTRVAFVSVTDNILGVVRYLAGEVPLHPGGEACATATAKTGSLQLLDDVLTGHLEKGFLKRLIPFTGNVFVNILRIDESTVAKYDAELLLVELDVLNLGMLAARLLVIEQAGNLAALDDMLADELFCILRLHFYIEGVFRKDLDDRALFTEAETTGLNDLYFVCNALCFALLQQVLVNLVCAAGLTCRSSTDQDVVSECHYLPPSFLMMSAAGRSNMWSVTNCLPMMCCSTILRAVAASTFP